MSEPPPPTDRPARPRRWLYPAAWLVVFLAGLGLGHALDVGRELSADDLDHRVWRRALAEGAERPGLTRAFRFFSHLGDTESAVPLVALLAAAIVVLGVRGRLGLRPADAAYLVGVALGGSLLVTLLKWSVGRARPEEAARLVEAGSSSFPSGHALNAACVAVAAATALAPAFRRLPAAGAVALGLVLAGLPPAIAASRVWLAVHYLSDVLAGLALGAGWAGLAALVRSGPPARRRAEARGPA